MSTDMKYHQVFPVVLFLWKRNVFKLYHAEPFPFSRKHVSSHKLFLACLDQNFFLSNDLKIVTIYPSAISYTIEILKCPSKGTKRCY